MKKASSNSWKRVGENLVRYVSSRTIYAVFRVPGRKALVRVSLGTTDLQTAKGLLPEKRKEFLEQENPPVEPITVGQLVGPVQANIRGIGVLVLNTYSHVIADHEKEMAKKLA